MLSTLIVFACTVSTSGAKVWVHRSQSSSLLPGPGRDLVLQQIRRLVTSCSVDSLRVPSIFSETGEIAWARVQSSDRIAATLAGPEPFAWRGGRADFEALLIELSPGNYPGLLLGRGPTSVVQFTKCDGLATIELVCLPELAPLLPARYGHSCQIIPAR